MRADRIERPLLMAAVERAALYKRKLDEQLARLIVAELGAAMKRGSR